MRRWIPVTALWSAGVMAHRALWLSGGRLHRPTGATLGDLDVWYRTVDPGEVPVVVAWAAGVAISAWLAAALALQLLAAVPGGGCLRPLADLVSPRSLQRLGRSLAGLSLTAGLAAGPSGIALASAPIEPPPVADSSPADPHAPGTATMSRLDQVEAASTVPTVVAPSTSSVPATPTSVDSAAVGRPAADDPLLSRPAGPAGVADADPDTAPAPSTDASGAAGSTGAPSLPPAPPAVAVSGQPSAPSSEHVPSETVVVEPGMSFWSIAAEALADAGHPSDDASVGRYWRRLIDANRGRLVVPDNPDLLLPGQVLLLPPR